MSLTVHIVGICPWILLDTDSEPFEESRCVRDDREDEEMLLEFAEWLVGSDAPRERSGRKNHVGHCTKDKFNLIFIIFKLFKQN